MTRRPPPGFEYTATEKERISWYRRDIAAMASRELYDLLIEIAVAMLGPDERLVPLVSAP